ncbi:transposase [Romeria aff. gracilis LEGE 07310]|uniref:Transposase n=2 Tax=Vasconcelosia minhoensis LEGE 07310 TaxID=915328 RepID=A0A8J7AK26_9CYAN|nr:transposase [Romeria aff. gracilis LEGE 07310]
MKARYQYRIYPTEQQQTKLAQLFGCCRVVWNDALALCRAAEKLPKNGDLQKTCITQAKRTDGRAWLGEVSNIPLQQSIADLGVAFKNFFASLKGERKGPKVRSPRFKKKGNRQTARFTRGGFSLQAAKVYLAKIGEIKTRWSRPLPSEPSSVTVIKDRSGRYFLSFVVEPEPLQLPAQSASVGVDLGLKTFAALSTGESVQAPDYSTLERKIRREQRQLSRRQKGSKRRERSRLRIAKLKAQLRDTRKDFLHQVSTRLIQENQLVCLEDLNVSGMLKNRRLSRAISQAGWREFRTLLESKAKRLGRQVQVISRWQPTSQLCSECGYRWGKLDLSVRELACLSCCTRHDRDINAARNINQSGQAIAHDAKRTGSPCQTPLGAVGVELSSHPYGEQLCLIS